MEMERNESVSKESNKRNESIQPLELDIRKIMIQMGIREERRLEALQMITYKSDEPR